MQQLIKTKLFSLIKESAQRKVPVTEWEKAYESFAKTVFEANENIESHATYHNLLCYARAELVCRQDLNGLKK